MVIKAENVSYFLAVPLKEAVEMDTKLLESEVQEPSLGLEALRSIANRQRRREFFYRSLVRSALLTLLFIAFGCFFAIYLQEKGKAAVFYSNGTPFDLRGMLKELFLLSVIPSACFALCFSFGGKICRLCDTVFPAFYGIAAGVYYYRELSSLYTSFSVTFTVKLLPYIVHVLFIIAVYTLFCPVCSSYGECRRQKSAVPEDKNSCFTYYLICITTILLSLVLRDSAATFFKMFG